MAWGRESNLICYTCINNCLKNIYWKYIFLIMIWKFTSVIFQVYTCAWVWFSFLFHLCSLPMSILYFVIIILIWYILISNWVCSPLFGLSSLFSSAHEICWPETKIDCHTFLQQRCVYLGSAEHCNLGSAIAVNHLQVPHRAMLL